MRQNLPSFQDGTLSSAYAPDPKDPGYQRMLDCLASIFAAHQEDGMITTPFDVHLCYGRLG